MSAWLNRTVQFLYAPRPTSPYDPEWQTDQAWGHKANAIATEDYEPIKKYAEDQYKEMREVFDAVDKKAEWIFGVAFAASGALLYSMKSWGLGAYCLPSLICTLAAMHWSLRAKATGSREAPLPIREAVNVFERDPSWKLVLIASVHCAYGALKRLVDWKGDELQKASGALFVAACLFGLPAIIASQYRQQAGADTGLHIDHFELSGSATGVHKESQPEASQKGQ